MNLYPVKSGRLMLPKLKVCRQTLVKNKDVTGKETTSILVSDACFLISGVDAGELSVFVKPTLCKSIA